MNEYYIYLFFYKYFNNIGVTCHRRAYDFRDVYFVIGFPFILMFRFCYRLLTEWVFNLKAFLIFGKGCKPVTLTQSIIIGKRNKNISLYKRWFLIPSDEDKIKYMKIAEEIKEIRGS